jgi:primosomal replication protein N
MDETYKRSSLLSNYKYWRSINVINKIIVIGNLGRDPELRYTPQGNAVCNFSVATSEKKRDKAGEMQEVTTWFRVTTWNKQAENASKYLTKGSPSMWRVVCASKNGRIVTAKTVIRSKSTPPICSFSAADRTIIRQIRTRIMNFRKRTIFKRTQAPPAVSPTDEDIPF